MLHIGKAVRAAGEGLLSVGLRKNDQLPDSFRGKRTSPLTVHAQHCALLTPHASPRIYRDLDAAPVPFPRLFLVAYMMGKGFLFFLT